MPFDSRPPVPLVEISIEAASPAWADRLHEVLSDLVAGDPQTTLRIAPGSGIRILGGVSEAQLAAKLAGLVRVFGEGCLIGPPTAVCRETIGRRAEIELAWRRPSLGGDLYARLRLLFEPAALGTGFRFVDASRSETAKTGAVRSGLETARCEGLQAGWQVTDLRATLLEAEHGRIEPEQALLAAAQAAFRQLRTRGAPRRLEPIMRLEVGAPPGLTETILSDLKRRGGRIDRIEAKRPLPVILAHAPLQKLFGYPEWARELSGGCARMTMRFDRYAPVEPDLSIALPA